MTSPSSLDSASQTRWQQKFATDYYLPHDPGRLGVEDTLRLLDGDLLERDVFGHKLGRGGFFRDDKGRAMVTSPDGARDEFTGEPVFVAYGSPSSAAVASDTEGLTGWRLRMLSEAFITNVDFADWATDQFSRVEEPVKEKMPGGWFKDVYIDEDYSKRNVLNRIVAEAEVVSGQQSASERGSFLHWVTEKVDDEDDWTRGDHVADALGFDIDHINRFAQMYADFSARHGLIHHATELAIVNDHARKAGTTDRVTELGRDLSLVDIDGVRHTIAAGTVVIGDVKTGASHDRWLGKGRSKRKVPKFRSGYSAQFATYAGGRPYDRVKGRRLRWSKGMEPSQEWALLIQVHADGVLNGRPEFMLEAVDLVKGRAYLEVSDALRRAESVADDASSFVLD